MQFFSALFNAIKMLLMDCKKYFKTHGLNLTKHDRVLGIWNWKLKFLVSIFFIYQSGTEYTSRRIYYVPRITLENVFSSPSSSQYTIFTLAVEETGFPTCAPWISSRTLLTRKLDIFSHSTKLTASIMLDFPRNKQTSQCSDMEEIEGGIRLTIN